jgi:Concanavalin A-like lectin/glucanases superfamily
MARLFVSGSSHKLEYGGGVVTVHSPLTIAAWIRPFVIVPHAVIGFVGTYATNTDFACLCLGPSTGISARTSVGSYVDSIITTAVPTTSWSHAAAVFTNATSRVAYLNAVAATPNTTSKSLTHSAYNRTGIGAKVNNNPETWYFNGHIGEVCMWNVALTAAEIQRLYQRENPWLVRGGSIVGYWPLHGLPGSVEPGYRPWLMSAVNMGVTGATASVLHPPVPLPHVGSVWIPGTSVIYGTLDLTETDFLVSAYVRFPKIVADLSPLDVGIPVSFGSAALDAQMAVSGAAVPVSFGAPSLQPVLAVAGAAVPVSFGEITATQPQVITVFGQVIPVSFGDPSVTVAAVYADGFVVPVALGQAQFAIGASQFLVPVSFGTASVVARFSAVGFLVPAALGVTGVLVLVSPPGFLVPWTSGFEHQVEPYLWLYYDVYMEAVEVAVEMESVDAAITLETVERTIELV